MNTVFKVENFLNSELLLEQFSDISLVNYLESHREALNVRGKYDTKDILYLFDSNNENYTQNYKKIRKKIFQSESLDPKKEYLPQKYFVRSKVWESINSELTRLIENIDDDGEIVFLACAKSTGKTLSQNIWIKENDALMESKKIFWIRCDIEKLVNLVKSYGFDNISKIEENIIGNYFDIQFLSVLCKNYNSEERSFFKQIFQELVGEQISLRISGDFKTPVYGEYVPILYVIGEYHKRILEFKVKGYKYNYGREIILKSAIGRVNQTMKIFDDWSRMSKKIQEILIKKGYKFLRIIDSVDNYKKYNNNGDYQDIYKFILEKICIFNHNYTENQIQEGSVAIIVRKNTYWDYFAFYNQTKREGRHRYDFSGKIIDAHEIKDKVSIQQKRYDFLKNDISTSEILDVFKKVIDHKVPQYSFLYDFLNSDKHIGFLLRNQFSLVPALVYFREKYNISIAALDAFIDNYLPSNLLLNGYFSLNSFCHQEIELGKMLFNIFYYEFEENNNNNKWQGLCCTRILQHLKNNEVIFKNDLIDYIHQLFCYNKNEIKNKISKLIEFSLLRLDLNEKSSVEKIDIDNPKIIITNKGIASLNLIYSDLDILYHCSLDTPVPRTLITKSFIHPHSNEIEIKNYALYCLKSALSFIQYLKQIDRDERSYIDGLDTRFNSQDYLLPIDANKKIHENLQKRVDYLMKSLKESVLHEFEEFLSNFKEIKINLPTIQEKENSNTICKRNPKNKNKTIVIAIASPANTIDREKLISSLERNFRDKGHEARCGFRLIVKGFEDLASQPGEPQLTINEKIIIKSDFVVAIFKHHLGTPTLRAESGTVEELLQGLDKSKSEMPLGLAYFNTKPPKSNFSDIDKAKFTLEQWEKVLEFKKSISGKMLWGKWTNQSDIESIILSDIEKNIIEYFSKKESKKRTTNKLNQINRIVKK